TGRYYYWNTETDDVCWLSPLHPKAKPGPAACRLAKIEWEKIAKKHPSSWSKRGRRAPSDDENSNLSAESDSDEEEQRRKPVKKTRYMKPSKGDLDPMDPASYSDVPR
uniref:WW domain-containing protein n=1 Tax=Romanomermis culicivorax TaxID=13658 RepID=A0A915J2T1_ROMCU